ncbi:hypothetical protein BX616_006112 [Lobosporangium transversale]|uniref:Uncharacterized protein n=1 Tax=Lobosporangium transversale TaxID=64571 RepID=A0A1Y2GQR9_9FUNG|nr:hypothetical protein BCR41DRAFT_351744 [Lobosporangium transversale]KAF9897138.1 hypothetical protein BX616_006112 [Lobosporangium transversale]ORZ19204.1 hypothetical protein BCR41DRAFT_351744 [Lobosporangium transversale]|eukprot:XP_021882372.1 hypothetical protein BCR41DRAFT_351744 [Lobosporangium transversale]
MATLQDKITSALASKDMGNEAFKQGDIHNALKQYHIAILALSGLDNQMAGVPMMSAMNPQNGQVSEEQKNVIKTNLAVVYANMAACHLKRNNYKRAIDVCNSALKNDPDNVKAKFRRGQAKSAEGNIAGAEADFLSLGENVPGVKAELEKLKKMSKEAEEKQRRTMGGFLSRGRIVTEEEELELEREKAAEAEAAAASSSSTSTKTTASTKPIPKSKPTVGSKASTKQKAKAVVKEEEYTPSTWSGTAPKIQELAEGEE